MMLFGGGVINYVVKRRGRGASRGTVCNLPRRAHTMSWGRSGLTDTAHVQTGHEALVDDAAKFATCGSI